MSGDEIDNVQEERYAITKLPWRSEHITAWLRTFDHIHLSTRFKSNGQPKRGAFPHARIPSRRVDHQAEPVPGLPQNFYDPTWLLSMDDAAREALRIQPELNLTHTPMVLRWVGTFITSTI